MNEGKKLQNLYYKDREQLVGKTRHTVHPDDLILCIVKEGEFIEFWLKIGKISDDAWIPIPDDPVYQKITQAGIPVDCILRREPKPPMKASNIVLKACNIKTFATLSSLEAKVEDLLMPDPDEAIVCPT